MKKKLIKISITNCLYSVFLTMLMLSLSDVSGKINMPGAGNVWYMTSFAFLGVTMITQFIYAIQILSDPQSTKIEFATGISAMLVPLIPVGLAMWLIKTKWSSVSVPSSNEPDAHASHQAN